MSHRSQAELRDETLTCPWAGLLGGLAFHCVDLTGQLCLPVKSTAGLRTLFYLLMFTYCCRETLIYSLHILPSIISEF